MSPRDLERKFSASRCLTTHQQWEHRNSWETPEWPPFPGPGWLREVSALKKSVWSQLWGHHLCTAETKGAWGTVCSSIHRLQNYKQLHTRRHLYTWLEKGLYKMPSSQYHVSWASQKFHSLRMLCSLKVFSISLSCESVCTLNIDNIYQTTSSALL